MKHKNPILAILVLFSSCLNKKDSHAQEKATKKNKEITQTVDSLSQKTADEDTSYSEYESESNDIPPDGI